MDWPPKLQYVMDLTQPVDVATAPGVVIRRVAEEDTQELAELMLDAYVGTIDYEDESLEDAIREVAGYFSGDPLVEHAYVATVGGEIVSAVLVSVSHGEPFIGHVMTTAARKNEGFGRLVVTAAVASLHRAGYEDVTFFITEGNTASEALFMGLGAALVPEA